jgi:hypothetical protein
MALDPGWREDIERTEIPFPAQHVVAMLGGGMVDSE